MSLHVIVFQRCKTRQLRSEAGLIDHSSLCWGTAELKTSNVQWMSASWLSTIGHRAITAQFLALEAWMTLHAFLSICRQDHKVYKHRLGLYEHIHMLLHVCYSTVVKPEAGRYGNTEYSGSASDLGSITPHQHRVLSTLTLSSFVDVHGQYNKYKKSKNVCSFHQYVRGYCENVFGMWNISQLKGLDVP